MAALVTAAVTVVVVTSVENQASRPVPLVAGARKFLALSGTAGGLWPRRPAVVVYDASRLQ